MNPPRLALVAALLAGVPLRGQWDTGFRSTSAIGQLGELTGQSIRMPRATGVRMTGGGLGSGGGMAGMNSSAAVNAMGTMVGTMILSELLSAAFSGNAAQAAAMPSGPSPAELALARAQAQAEAAARLRQDWDRRDAELSAQLDGVFEVKRSTNFFGIQSNADPALVREALNDTREPTAADYAPVDLSSIDVPSTVSADVVDLSGASTDVVPLLRAPTASLPRGSGASHSFTSSRVGAEATLRPQIELGENAAWAANYLGGQIEAIGHAGLWEISRGLPGYSIAARLNSVYENISAARDVLEHPLAHATLGLAHGAMDDAGAAANYLGTGAGYAPDNLAQRGAEYQRLVRDEIRGQIAGQISPSSDDYQDVLREPELGKSDVIPLNKYPHPDWYRLQQILR